jgi:hypothetical protein
MNFMKGLNCYAGFWDKPGLEKTLTSIPSKSSFLRPVTPKLPHRRPSLGSAVDEPCQGRMFLVGTFWPSTVFFLVFYALFNGRARLPGSHPQAPSRAGQLPSFNFPIYARRAVKDRFVLARTSCVRPPSPVSLQSAVFLSSSPQVDGGLQSFQLPYHAFVVLAARRFFQGLIYFTERWAPRLPGACRFLGKHGDI